ncbi:MAG: hypothetical protein KZQ94_08580 [Candidatus Thiodiazotropha sp. (ex Troendleina suluensis)]|nr:hypothetical protein [Candidatus Thiodiazotropha sp. (ex Troendleina suluensis)]
MNIFDDLSEKTSESINDHELKTITVLDDNYDHAVDEVASVVPDHYISPESIALILEWIGKPEAIRQFCAPLGIKVIAYLKKYPIIPEII